MVRVCADDESGAYSFACPLCGTPVSRLATPRILALLVSAGVPTEVWNLPAELAEPRSGPPITTDDVLDFHLLLQQEGWFETLAAQVPKQERPPRPRRRAVGGTENRR
jgi:hypothetical protein